MIDEREPHEQEAQPSASSDICLPEHEHSEQELSITGAQVLHEAQRRQRDPGGGTAEREQRDAR
jgi:hypothetical protein